MDEKIIIKGKRKSSISIFVGFIVAGIVALLSYFLYSVNSYRSYAYISPAGTRTTRTISLGEAISKSIRCDGGLPFVAIGVVIFIIIGYIIYKNWSKIEITVSDKRVEPKKYLNFYQSTGRRNGTDPGVDQSTWKSKRHG